MHAFIFTIYKTGLGYAMFAHYSGISASRQITEDENDLVVSIM